MLLCCFFPLNFIEELGKPQYESVKVLKHKKQNGKKKHAKSVCNSQWSLRKIVNVSEYENHK